MSIFFRLTLVSFVLSSCAFFAPKNQEQSCLEERSIASANMCMSLFGATTNHTLITSEIEKSNAEILSNRSLIAELQTEVAKPENVRGEKDPRWFSKWRNSENNPITIRLKDQIAELQKRNDILAENVKAHNQYRDRILSVENQLGQLKQDVSSLTRVKIVSDQLLDAQLKKWAMKTHRSLEDQLYQATRMTGDAQFSVTRLEAVEKQIKETKDIVSELSGAKITQDIYAKVNTFYEARSTSIGGKAAKEVLGREPSDVVVNGMVSTAATTRTPLKKAFEIFKQIDQLGEQKRKGIKDTYVAMLTRTSLSHKKSANEVIDLFIKIDTLGAETKEKFTLYDAEAAMLTELAVSTNSSPEKVMKTFFELEGLSRTYKGEHGFLYANDQSLVVITDYAVRNNATDLPKLMNDFFKSFDLGSTTKNKFHINDLGTSIVLASSKKSGMTLESANRKYFELLEKLDGGNALHDEVVAHYAEIMISFDISAEQLVPLKDQVDKILPVASVAAKKGVIARAIVQARSQKRNLPNEADIMTQAALARLSPEKMVDWLVDSSNHGKNDVRVNTGGSVSFEPSSSGSEPSYSTFQMSLSMDGDFKPNLNLSSQIGMDLSDGSLTVNVGGIRFDTDGDGPSFNF